MQVIVTRTPRRLANVSFGLGHNNDQGLMRLTGIDLFIEMLKIFLLGDGGYHHPRIITPSTVPCSLEQYQKDERSVVEIVIGLAKGFERLLLVPSDKAQSSTNIVLR